jgi:hypothetical protein
MKHAEFRDLAADAVDFHHGRAGPNQSDPRKAFH